MMKMTDDGESSVTTYLLAQVAQTQCATSLCKQYKTVSLPVKFN